jgi:hypothetical protein
VAVDEDAAVIIGVKASRQHVMVEEEGAAEVAVVECKLLLLK